MSTMFQEDRQRKSVKTMTDPEKEREEPITE